MREETEGPREPQNLTFWGAVEPSWEQIHSLSGLSICEN